MLSISESSNNNTRLDSLLNTRLDEDENFMEAFNYLNENLHGGGANLTEKALKIAIEDRELELNQQYLEQNNCPQVLSADFNINSHIQSFVGKIRGMNTICHEMTNRIQLNKEKTQELLKKTAILQNEKKELVMKQTYLSDFFAKYLLTEDEEKALCLLDGKTGINDAFFKAFNRLNEVNFNVVERIAVEPENFALVEISQLLSDKLETAYNTLYQSIQSEIVLGCEEKLREFLYRKFENRILFFSDECRLLNVEFFDLKSSLIQSFELIQLKPELFSKALEDYGYARRNYLVRAFIEILTKGTKSIGFQKPIEQLSTDPIRYVNEMFSWIQSSLLNEKEIVENLLRGCTRLEEKITEQILSILSSISEAFCQPLRLRVEQCITREGNCIVLYRLSNLLLYFVDIFNSFELLPPNSHFLLCCRDLQELCSNMFFSSVSSAVQKILANARVPDYDLLPVNSVNQTLLLLRDILESPSYGTLTVNTDKREIYNKIFQHILDPLIQSIQLVCSNLDNFLDVSVYMLNCLNSIRSILILYQFTEKKLEMIKAQIEANEDVLVSEQASLVLDKTDMMEIYTKAMAHEINQGQLSKITGMEPNRVKESIAKFNQFLLNIDCYNCNQLAKVSSTSLEKILNSIQRRTNEHIFGAYKIIYQKIVDPLNGYPSIEQIKNIEEVETILCKLFDGAKP
ncbi:Conserved oligomeric Golgi complex subunit 6 [Meloidogyne graminicola]|uniref:Conserved oligomeric Golgi complex subunit 6 n=1 Tax=Meloidogyne graminicola TaxID=189291 RepID=A0A8T0A514_9BILA|nr:Conserved oligomeric Golgi complex subunit 6 [Meloidogyne graminicola]